MEKRLKARGMAVPVKEIRQRKPDPASLSIRSLRNSERGVTNFDKTVTESSRVHRRKSIGICAENVIQSTSSVTSSEEPYLTRVTRRLSKDATVCAESVMSINSLRQHKGRDQKSPRYRRASIGYGGGRKTSRQTFFHGGLDTRLPSSHVGVGANLPFAPQFDSAFDKANSAVFDGTTVHENGYSAVIKSNECFTFPDSSDFSSCFNDPTDLSSSGYSYEYSSDFAETTDYGYGDDSLNNKEYENNGNNSSIRDNVPLSANQNSPQAATKTKGRRTTKVPRRSSLVCKCQLP